MSATPDIQADGLPAYKAFISYSHKDELQARRLHRRLESYRIPKGLPEALGGGGQGLGAIFRDKDELSASPELDASIKTALRASKNLIVLCSPHAARSRWVDQEVSYFKSLGRADNIFTVILSGEPFAQDRGLAAEAECLPHALRFKLTEEGDLGTERAEPLAADFRDGGDGEKTGTLKLLSGLLGVGLDRLLQRQLMRARRRTMGLGIAATIIVSVLSTLTWTAYSSQQRAEARRADAENFVEFLLSDLSQQLESYGRLDLLDAVGEKAVNYYNQLDEADFDAKANGRRARTFHFMGELQNALGETENSENYFNQSYDITKASLALDPQDADRIFEHARSAYMRSIPFRRRVDYANERVHLKEYLALCEKLLAAENGSDRALTQMGLAKMNIGRVKLRTDDIQGAQSDFEQADAFLGRVNARSVDVQALLYLTENMAWRAESYKVAGALQMSYDVRSAQAALLQARHSQAPDDFRLTEGLVYAKLGLGNAAIYMSRFDEGAAYLDEALAETETALRLEPNREKMRRAKSAALMGLMNMATQQNDATSYAQRREELSRLQAQPMTASVRENRYWNEILPRTIAVMDAAYTARVSTP